MQCHLGLCGPNRGLMNVLKGGGGGGHCPRPEKSVS